MSNYRLGWKKFLPVVAWMLLPGYSDLSAQQWTSKLIFSENGAVKDSLLFGIHPDATGGIDAVLGELELPPKPVFGVFDVRFTGTGLGNGLKTDIRSNTVETVEYIIDIQRSEGGAVTLSWGSLPQGTFVLQDMFNGILGIDVDMSVVYEFTITNPAINRVRLIAIIPLEWTVKLAFSEGGTAMDSLHFGAHPDATDGIDAALGELELPPLPVMGVFDARFIGQGLGNGVKKDLRAKSRDVIEYVINIQRTGAGPVTVSWDGLPPGDFILQDMFGGALGIDVDMNAASQFEITNPALNQVKIVVTPGSGSPANEPPQFVTASLQDAFESQPYWGTLAVSDPDINDSHTFEKLDGPFWLSVSPSGVLSGIPLATDVGENIPVSIRVTDSGGLEDILNTTINVFGAGIPPPDWLFTLMFSEDGILKDSLQLGIHPDATDGLDPALGETELPPLPVAGVFDARFAGFGLGNGVKKELKSNSNIQNEYVIDIQRAQGGNVTIVWGTLPPGTFVLQDMFGGPTGLNRDMSTIPEITIANPEIVRIKIIVSLSPEISYGLEFSENNVVKDTLRFGIHPEATDGLDPAIGEIELPPKPVAGVFDVRFTGSALGNGIKKDLRIDTPVQKEYIIDIQRAEAGTITISWDGLAEGAFTLQDGFGGIFFNIDMTAANQAAITDTEITRVKILFTPSEAVPVAEYGDINESGSINADDAVDVLRHVVRKVILTPAQQVLADVSGNGTVSAYDGSLILRYFVGLIAEFPVKTRVPKFTLPKQLGVIVSLENKEDEVYLSVDIGNVSGIFASEAVFTYDDSRLEFISAEEKGLITESRVDNGKLTIAAADLQEMTDEIIKLKFKSSSGVSLHKAITLSSLMVNEALIENVEVTSTGIAVPDEYGLSQNYPNPFNPSTVISYSLQEAVHVKLEVFNVLGQKVRTLKDDYENAGYHHVTWDGRNDSGLSVSAGVYIYRYQAGAFSAIKKMMFIK